MVISAIELPHEYYREGDGNTKFIRTVNGRRLYVICQPLEDQRKWLVKTLWVRGEDDEGRVVKKQNKKNADIFLVLFLLFMLLLLVLWYFYAIGSFSF